MITSFRSLVKTNAQAKQLLSLIKTIFLVDIQNIDCNSPNRGKADQHWPFPAKMIPPIIGTRVE